MRAADYIVDVGPGAGVHGGEIVATGTAEEIMACPESHHRGTTSPARRKSRCLTSRRPGNGHVPHRPGGGGEQPARILTSPSPWAPSPCVTGVSGSGKSSLVNEIIYQKAGGRPEPGQGPPGQARRPSRGRSFWTRSSTSTSPPSAAPPAPTRPPTPGCSTTSGSCSPPPRTPRPGATARGGSPSTSGAAGARPAPATGSSRSRCTSSPTSMSPARCARASATTGRPWRSSTRARTSTRCWR